jgi:hypothetical protein
MQEADASSKDEHHFDSCDVPQVEAELDHECFIAYISLLDHTLDGDIFESVLVGSFAVSESCD